MNFLKENIGYKNILILLGVILALIFVFKGPGLIRSLKTLTWKVEIPAQVLNITERTASVQHLSGSGNKTIGYEISYSYVVGDSTFSNIEATKPGADSRMLYDNFNQHKNCVILIRYNEKDPSESCISSLHFSK